MNKIKFENGNGDPEEPDFNDDRVPDDPKDITGDEGGNDNDQNEDKDNE